MKRRAHSRWVRFVKSMNPKKLVRPRTWQAIALLAGFAYAWQSPAPVDNFTGHPRVIVISDEPDDQMSLVRLLLYSNELDIEALVAATSTWQKTVTHPETMRTLIQAYGMAHRGGAPEQSIHRPAGLRLGSEGATAIIRAADAPDPRPLWVGRQML